MQSVNSCTSFVNYLARSACVSTGLYFACVNVKFFYLTEAQISQDLPDRFSQSFHRLKAFRVKIIDLKLYLLRVGIRLIRAADANC